MLLLTLGVHVQWDCPRFPFGHFLPSTFFAAPYVFAQFLGGYVSFGISSSCIPLDGTADSTSASFSEVIRSLLMILVLIFYLNLVRVEN